MSEVFPGRFTTGVPQDASAVFLIGMRVNTFRGLIKARSVFTAMPRMMKFLYGHPESGLLGSANWFGRTTILVSYWRSPADVQRFASDPSAPHAAAWRKFNQRIGSGPDVGIWHELYTVRPGDYEGVYVNMPKFGLAAAAGHVPVGDGTRTSKQRMARA
jgi:hypothetical protein